LDNRRYRRARKPKGYRAHQQIREYVRSRWNPPPAKTVTPETIAQLKDLAQNPKVVAIGETGLDYYYDNSPREDQKRAFARQLKIAAELNLPIIVHCRKAFDETMDILDEHGRDVKKVVFHCFSGSAEQAKIVLTRGYHISFTGVVTFKNADKTREAANVVPLDKLMLETDCPYMSPEPMRKQKISEPALMIHTAKFLADLKGMDLADFAQKVTATTNTFFNLPV
jgi:TatD DNase family protein